ncbi:MAG: PilZ domain-containing protein [Acidobacteriota bacterium]|nr:PilZ domain-containing protein [Acidobacteriota bacterium]
MREARQFKRFPYLGTGELRVDGKDYELSTVNLSKGGACLCVGADAWAAVGEDHGVTGHFNIEDKPVSFHGRICWSSEGEEQVHFGVAFEQCDFEILRGFLERNSVVEEHRIDSFNL